MSRLTYSAGALILVVLAVVGIRVSSAEFTDGSTTRAQIGASPDWTPPSVEVDDPGFVLDGTRLIPVTASDEDSSVATVEVQYRKQGVPIWTTICTDTGAPWGCSWNTTTVTDGVYYLRATATDAYNNSATSAEVSREVVNTAGIIIDPVQNPTRGVVALHARTVGPGSGASTITFQYAVTLAGPWTNISPACTGLAGPDAICNFDTGTNSGTFQMRAVGTFNSTSYYDVQQDIVVDNAAPMVAQVVPGTTIVAGYTWVSGSVDLTATATDLHTSVTSVLFEYRATGAGSWSTACVDTTLPYSCTLDTDALPEGSYEFQTTGTDAVGNTTTTPVVTRYVDRSDPTGTLTLPGATYVPQAVLMTVDASDQGTGVRSVQLQYKTNAALTWTTLCTDASAPYSCTTPNLDNGVLYNFRAVITDNRALTHTTTVLNRTVDGSAPTVSQTIPAGTLSGSAVSLTATAADTQSGVASVEMQYKLSTSGTWSTACVDSSAPYGCSLDTIPLPSGSYNFRTIGTNNAGASTTTVTDTRTVANPGSVSVTAPAAGANIMGTTAITATASAPSGVTGVDLQYKTTAAATWTTLCTDTGSPYSCDWDTSSLPYGGYQVRAVLTAGNTDTFTSAVVSVTVERFRGVDVQATFGSNQGQPGAGDTITLTYSSTVDLTTVKAGWNGSSTAAPARLNDAGVAGGPGLSDDWLSFASVDVGTVAFDQNYVDPGRTVYFDNATMVASTVVVNGRNATQIVITLNAATVNTNRLNDTNATVGLMRWTPAGTVTDTSNNTILTDLVNETGANDLDL